jgi:hypothetical protein
MAQLSHKEGMVEFSHRFMLEQRFVGRYSSESLDKEDEFPFMHRMRYMVGMQLPLKGKEIKDKTPYVALYDEIFIGFGRNVNANVFDQNRIGLLFGYRFSPQFRLERGILEPDYPFWPAGQRPEYFPAQQWHHHQCPGEYGSEVKTQATSMRGRCLSGASITFTRHGYLSYDCIDHRHLSKATVALP